MRREDRNSVHGFKGLNGNLYTLKADRDRANVDYKKLHPSMAGYYTVFFAIGLSVIGLIWWTV